MVLGFIKRLHFIPVVILVSCSSPSTGSFSESSTKSSTSSKALYTIHCEACHGADGKKGISGAADLSLSKITSKQIRNTILNGNQKGMMPYKEIITNPVDLDSLVSYVQTLRKK